MTLQELRYIVAVAEEASFTRAAERVFVSQPALSASVQKLEEELGVSLFERRRGAVVTTEIGHKVVAQARRVLTEAAEVKRVAEAERDPLAGTLRIGVIHTIGPYLLPRLLPAMAQLAPALTLLVEETTTESIEQGLKDERLDVAIVATQLDLSGADSLLLYDEPFAVLIPEQHRWADAAAIEPLALASEARVFRLSEVHCFSQQVEAVCPELLNSKQASPSGNSLETLKHLVRQGLGVTVLPISALAEPYRVSGTLVLPFQDPAPQRRVTLCIRRSFSRPSLASALARAIRRVADPSCTVLGPMAEV